MAMMQWSNEKVEAYKNTEEIAPEMAEKLKQHEALNMQMMQMRMNMTRPRYMRGVPGNLPGQTGSETPPTDTEFEAFSKKSPRRERRSQRYWSGASIWRRSIATSFPRTS